MGLNTASFKQKIVMHTLDYCATFMDATLTLDASDTILHIQSDASFLSEPKTKCRDGGYFSYQTTKIHMQINTPMYYFYHFLRQQQRQNQVQYLKRL